MNKLQLIDLYSDGLIEKEKLLQKIDKLKRIVNSIDLKAINILHTKSLLTFGLTGLFDNFFS